MAYVKTKFKARWGAYHPGANPLIEASRAEVLEARGVLDIVPDVADPKPAKRRRKRTPAPAKVIDEPQDTADTATDGDHGESGAAADHAV